MAAMEEEHGGLVRAMVARMKQRRAAKKEVDERRQKGEEVETLTRPGGPAGPGGTLTSFHRGLDTLPEALSQELGDAVRLGIRVTALSRAEGGGLRDGGADRLAEGADEDNGAQWLVHTEGMGTIPAHAVVVAVPSPHASPLFGSLDQDVARVLGQIPTAGLSVVAMAFDASELGGPPKGFGFLVPREAGLRILGCLWDSSIFPGRAPRGKVLVRVMVGGAHDPEAVTAGEEELVGQVADELEITMGLSADPLFHRLYRWPLGIGQYTVGHGERMRKIEEGLRSLGGLWVAGSSFYGISMNACIEKAPKQARQVLDSLMT
jgi:oxygen-dependent protoporphyrinogen oxidase